MKDPHKKFFVYLDSTSLGGGGGGLNAILATQYTWGVSYEVPSLRKNINTCDIQINWNIWRQKGGNIVCDKPETWQLSIGPGQPVQSGRLVQILSGIFLRPLYTPVKIHGSVHGGEGFSVECGPQSQYSCINEC